MRYTFLNMAEFFNHSLILRSGPVRPLEVALRPEVARFITTTKSGKVSLQDTRGRPAILRARPDDASRYVDGEPARHNSYQWDFVMNDGDFFKGGFGGQGLYISPSRDLVIAFFGTFDADGKGHQLARVARQLAKSGLFSR